MSRNIEKADDSKAWIIVAVMLAILPLLACVVGGAFLLIKAKWNNQMAAEQAAVERENAVRANNVLPDAKGLDPANTRLTGKWSGAYHYPGEGQPPVAFDFTISHAGPRIVGSTKEPNTFGRMDEPFLFAHCKGTFDKQSGMLTWRKTYDGTAGVSSSAEYSGQLAPDGAQIDGTWVIRFPGRPDFSGRFTIRQEKRDK